MLTAATLPTMRRLTAPGCMAIAPGNMSGTPSPITTPTVMMSRGCGGHSVWTIGHPRPLPVKAPLLHLLFHVLHYRFLPLGDPHQVPSFPQPLIPVLRQSFDLGLP